MPRKYTNKLIDEISEEYWETEYIVLALLKWMSEQDVKEFYQYHRGLNDY